MAGAVSEFLPEMESQIVVANPSTGRTLFGVQSMAAGASTYSAHLQLGAVASRYTEGLREEATGMAWVASTSKDAITRASRVTLPDGTSPPVMRVLYRYDELGFHHTVVIFG